MAKLDKLAIDLKKLLPMGYVAVTVPAEGDWEDDCIEVHGPDGDTGFHLQVGRGYVEASHIGDGTLTTYPRNGRTALVMLADEVLKAYGDVL